MSNIKGFGLIMFYLVDSKNINNRYVPQDFSRVSDAIESGSFFANPALCLAIDEAKSKDGTLHILVLLSTGGERPVPICICPTSELPICLSGKPTIHPEQSS
jgi:hypothetical protein